MKETHDLLIEAMQKYFAANLKWESSNTHTAAKETRKHLAEIRRLAFKRRAEVQSQRKPRGIPRGDNIGKFNSERRTGKTDNT